MPFINDLFYTKKGLNDKITGNSGIFCIHYTMKLVCKSGKPHQIRAVNRLNFEKSRLKESEP